MEIPKERMAAAIAIVNAKLKLSDCTTCQSRQWHLDSTIYQLPTYRPVGPSENRVLSVAVLYCAVCGHQIFMNATTVGLLKEDGSLIFA